MGIARSEIRHMIEHMAKLMVQEADSWANTYGPEARLCPHLWTPDHGGRSGTEGHPRTSVRESATMEDVLLWSASGM